MCSVRIGPWLVITTRLHFITACSLLFLCLFPLVFSLFVSLSLPAPSSSVDKKKSVITNRYLRRCVAGARGEVTFSMFHSDSFLHVG